VQINYPREGRRGWRRFIPSWKLVLGTIVSLGIMAASAFAVVFAVAYYRTEIPEQNEVAAAQTSIVYWSDGESELARLGDTNRISVPNEEIPEHVRYAVLSAEDRNFYEHWGFDVVGLLRAVWSNLTSGSQQGGSTITQQLAKNAYLTSEKTYLRKFNELVLAVKLEVTRTKDEILDDYLNTIFYGRGAYGIETAAESYFREQSRDLTLGQGAVLASVINAPALYNPDTEDGLENLQNRYEYVLNGMVDEGWLEAAERDEALADFPKISKRRTSERFGGTNGYLLRAVNDELLDSGFTDSQIESGGLRVTSTFDKKDQKAAVEAVEAQGPNTGTEGLRIGLAAVEPGTGEVVAMYGGADYLENSLNNATQAIQQAGSTFKPFGLAAAVEDGIGLDSLWPGNSPTEVQGYDVVNYADNSYGSLITLLRGTEESVNTVYVAVEAETGVDPVKDAAARAGVPTETPGFENSDLTFVLGTASPHTIDIATAYATFAARGERADATVLRTVETSHGTTLYERPETTVRAFDRNTADLVNYALQSVARSGTGRKALALGRPVAAKTGSTDEYMSAWFAGYTPQLATAVSFSKDGPDGNPVSLSGTGGLPAFYGSSYPGSVWTAFMSAALEGEDVEDFTTPEQFPSGGGATPTPTEVPSVEPTVTDVPSEEPSAEPTEEVGVEPTDAATDDADQPSADAGAGGAADTNGQAGSADEPDES
jgi:membrane peptidoglycan carboxypeptidase